MAKITLFYQMIFFFGPARNFEARLAIKMGLEARYRENDTPEGISKLPTRSPKNLLGRIVRNYIII